MYYNFYAELKKRNWKQIDLANFLGITVTTCNQRLLGNFSWDIKDIKKCLKEFNTTFEYLFETKED